MERCTNLFGALADNLDDGWVVATENDRHAGLDDARLLRGDFLHRVPEPVAVVESDPRDNRKRRLADIGRIETSAEAHFKYAKLDV